MNNIKRIKFAGRDMLFNLQSEADNSVFSEIFEDLDYNILSDYLKRSRYCVIDVGANIGLFTLFALAKNPELKVFAFEPDERNYLLMRENIKDNGFLKNVVAKNVAISGNGGKRTLFLSKDNHNHSLYLQNEDEALKREVFTYTLDDVFAKFLKKEGLQFCDILKMDCEGAEYEILLNGSQKALSKTGCVLIEYHNYFLDKDEKTLSAHLLKNDFDVKIFQSRYDKRMGFIFGLSKKHNLWK